MAKSKQLRVQLSFRCGDEKHLNVYRYLKSRDDRTEYIVKLIQADLLNQAIQQGKIVELDEPENAGSEIDYTKIIELLKPTLDMLVGAAVNKAIANLPLTDPQNGTCTEPAESAAPQSEDMSFALEGLKAFTGFDLAPKEGEVKS